MNKRLGIYITKKEAGEVYKAYVPPILPPNPSIDLEKIYEPLEKATLALAELNAISKSIPNPSLFIYMYVRKEALLSSQIEGTQSSFSDLMLFEHDQKTSVSIDDVEEVSNYVKAVMYALQRVKSGLPISLRLIKEAHRILLSGTRGSRKSPGQFRRLQNWIGGTKPSNALFVPPPVEMLNDCLANLEKFIHDKTLPVLVKAGLVHAQFETIHPFLDGNGRIGRLLIILLLCDGGLLSEPILYLSLYLKQHRQVYYSLLQEVRTDGSWETWLEFFLKGVASSSKQAVATINDINDLFFRDQKKIATLGRARYSGEKIFEYLKLLPQVTVPFLAKEIEMSQPTVRSALNHMVSLDILEVVDTKKRNKVYVYKEYFSLLEKGTDPIL